MRWIPQPEEQTEVSIANYNNLCWLTEEFEDDDLCDSKINPNLANAIHKVLGRKLNSEKLKIRLHKYLKPENYDQFSPTLTDMEIFRNILAHS